MKKHVKKALEHEVELLGRSVSVLVIAGLLIVGGASAALLSSFGTLEGEATVTDKAVTVEGPSSVSYDGNLDVGQTTVDSFTVNSQTSETEVDYGLNLEREANGGDSGNMNGVDTTVYSASGQETGQFVYNIDSSDAGNVTVDYDVENGEVVIEGSIEDRDLPPNDDEYQVIFMMDQDRDGTPDAQMDFNRKDSQGGE
ncbi:MAG: hypothetical protein ACLFTA_01760 [Candidatus Nanohaloarchaea archaeon]